MREEEEMGLVPDIVFRGKQLEILPDTSGPKEIDLTVPKEPVEIDLENEESVGVAA